MGTATAAETQDYDRMAELRAFDELKLGVKGLMDSNSSSIPRFFVHPPESRVIPAVGPRPSALIPTVDLSAPHAMAAAQIRQAASSWGFFNLVNHGIDPTLLQSTIDSVKTFNEQPHAQKAPYYTRDPANGVAFATNFDLYQSKAASWRDTLQVRMSPVPADPGFLPEPCRAPLLEWGEQATSVAERLMGFLSESLGLGLEFFKGMSGLEGRQLVAHYYPCCPEPELTVGLAGHSDPGLLTVLLQDQVGGLQVLNEEEWIDVRPVPGALVVNVGDLLQIVSNGVYKSVEHRVLANPSKDPRISVAIFYSPGKRDDSTFYGPIEELLSPQNPPKYRNFTMTEYLGTFFNKGLKRNSLLDHFKL
ncbi:hypothetical protein AMTRI_Chr01g133500 [Amborella trichopoda]|uniref:Fe2OG dioxygenase domain-containing protein n=1 Tax=Amborella trichopoda TaxID=13333 RepID=W1Q0H8_AMBTC|nr:1-aminocyclopropane-1-carboxylate oxidase homolog 6 [Amborella trichopoda]ERN14044.1 hypothetical protein AMTR_s00021p00210180 [Amborella trichopoda]|eukprot:XP_006852577.1 1-aminocyclopropane-1-carboxylate oxidase homolog 6 [Amborella trichopoda]